VASFSGSWPIDALPTDATVKTRQIFAAVYIAGTAARARAAGIEHADAVTAATDLLVVAASPEHLAHATDYLDAFSTVVIAWQWLELAAAAAERAARTGESGFTRAKRAACAYWLATELPRVSHLIDLVRSDETSFTALAPDDF